MSFNIQIEERHITLTEAEMVRAWWETADLYDNDHFGSAAVTVGSEVLALDEKQWQELYATTSTHLERVVWADIIEFEEAPITH